MPALPTLILEKLAEAGIDFILVGGLASVTQGAPITTVDVDIVHAQTDENIDKLISLLRSLDAHYRGRPDHKRIEPQKHHLMSRGHQLLATTLGPLDVLGVIEEGRAYAQLLQDAIEIDFRGYRIKVLKLEAILRFKRSSKRPKDRQVVPILEATLQAQKNPDDLNED